MAIASPKCTFSSKAAQRIFSSSSNLSAWARASETYSVADDTGRESTSVGCCGGSGEGGNGDIGAACSIYGGCGGRGEGGNEDIRTGIYISCVNSTVSGDDGGAKKSNQILKYAGAKHKHTHIPLGTRRCIMLYGRGRSKDDAAERDILLH